ncbi:MAG TPA: hypothetical protein VGM06_22110 [Polyangiaceae bacterium]|jgi:hypothetical protein
MGGNTCEVVVGRLLEVRYAPGPNNVVDVLGMIDLVAGCLDTLEPSARFAVVADWRAVPVMSPENAARTAQMLADRNDRVVRSAVLTPPGNPTTHMQIARLVHEAENSNRKHFASPHALYRWLSEILTEAESKRLRAFLAIGVSGDV